MALATYSDLKTAVANWLERSDLTDRIPDFIALAERRVYRTLRIPPMEAVTSYNLNAATGKFALPDTFLEAKAVALNTSPVRTLERRSWKEVNSFKNDTDATETKPIYFAREGSNLIFGPAASSAYEVNMYYWGELPPLSDSNTTNWFMTNAPNLFLYASLVEGSIYLHDEVMEAKWSKRLNEDMAEIQSMSDTAEWSGSGLMVKQG